MELTSEGSEGAPGVDREIVVAFKRLLMSKLVIDGSETEDGRIVMDGSETDNEGIVIDGNETEDGRIVIDGSETDDGRMVKDDDKPVSVTGGNRVAVELSITGTTAEKLVTGCRPDMLGIKVTGIVFTIGLPSGPFSTIRLASLTTVCVPLRAVPIGGLPKPCVNVHKPSA
jgi:hypothetical protein